MFQCFLCSLELRKAVIAVAIDKMHYRHTKTYTDAPDRGEVLPGGEIKMDGWRGILLHWETTSLQNPEGESTLAIRWACNGRRLFESERTCFAVDDQSYLIFNLGRRFSSTIQSSTPVECCTLCFAPPFAEEVLRDLITPADHLLDMPKGDLNTPVHFLEKTYPHDALVSPLLFRLQQLRDSDLATHGWFEEQFQLILVALLQSHRNVLGELEKLPAVRAATRMEIYRRLHRARDFMEAGLSDPLTLPQIADAAWLSPYHFLRLFKQTFGETPHRYLTRRRIERAKHLLMQTDLSVTAVCIEVGFDSLGSFSLLFRNEVGSPPGVFRAAARKRVICSFSKEAGSEHKRREEADEPST